MNFSQEDIDRFWSKVDIKGDDECWNWLAGLSIYGYGAFNLNGPMKGAHCCSLFLAHAVQPLNKTWALHTCLKNRKCCNPNHLYYGDNQDNSNDKQRDGTEPIGERNGNSKLTEIEVREIREKYILREYSQQKLAEEYGVSRQLISCIINNKIWKHI